MRPAEVANGLRSAERRNRLSAGELGAYDAAYLALAARHGVPLATVDPRLQDAAARAGIEVLG